MSKKYSHVIWDWNGTLFDDAWLCRDIVNGLLIERSKPILSDERYQEVFDFPVKEYYVRAGFDFTTEPYETAATAFIETYEQRRSECRLRKGALEAFKRLAEGGCSQSILSAYAKTTLVEVVGSFGIASYFERIDGLDNFYAAGKIDLGKKMIAGSGLDKEQVVMTGDTTHDYEVASAIGVSCILIPGGHHSRRKLETCGVPTVESLQQAVDVILGV